MNYPRVFTITYAAKHDEKIGGASSPGVHTDGRPRNVELRRSSPERELYANVAQQGRLLCYFMRFLGLSRRPMPLWSAAETFQTSRAWRS